MTMTRFVPVLILLLTLLVGLPLLAADSSLSPIQPATQVQPTSALSALSTLSRMGAPTPTSVACPTRIHAAWSYLAQSNYTGLSITPVTPFSVPWCCFWTGGDPNCRYVCSPDGPGSAKCYNTPIVCP